MSLVIAIDFDGTIVEHMYPEVGDPVPGAVEVMKEIIAAGNKIVLFTMRSGDRLDEAVQYIKDQGIVLHGINVNPDQKEWTDSPKAYAQIYIDDAALGCPLMLGRQGTKPMVDWERVRNGLYNKAVIGSR